MNKYIQTQTRKMIGAFAGVGALIEDTKGVIKIAPINKWTFFKEDKHLEHKHHINDNRLLYRLKNDKGFPKIKYLIQMPENAVKGFSGSQDANPSDDYNIAAGNYFPEWMFCNTCNRFNKISKWWKKWKKVVNQYDNVKNASDNFTPPKCGYCYAQAKESKSKNTFYNLTQVRFIMTSSDAKIRDIPWENWITYNNQKKSKDKELIDINNWSLCCDNQDLRYKHGDFDGLAGISIKCKSCKKRTTLTGIFNINFPSNKEGNHKYKTVIRSSNSVYYPI
jgi:hypothetical protein